MPRHDSITLQGSIIHLIYGPKGGIEGVLLRVGSKQVQLVLDKDDHASAAYLVGVAPDTVVAAVVAELPPSDKGPAAHARYQLHKLPGMGRRGAKAGATATQRSYTGKVVRLNYARHGEANGVVLDSGDFIHTRPDGMRKLDLKPGSKVEAEGEARPLLHGGGQVVEASRVNGVAMGKAPPKAPAKAAKKAVKKAAKKVVKKGAKKVVKKAARNVAGKAPAARKPAKPLASKSRASRTSG